MTMEGELMKTWSGPRAFLSVGMLRDPDYLTLSAAGLGSVGLYLVLRLLSREWRPVPLPSDAARLARATGLAETEVSGWLEVLLGVGWVEERDGRLGFPDEDSCPDWGGVRDGSGRPKTIKMIPKDNQDDSPKESSAQLDFEEAIPPSDSPLRERESVREGEEEQRGRGRGVGKGKGYPLAPEPLRDLQLYSADSRLCLAWDDLLPSWERAFPGVDVLAEVRKAHAWETSNPDRRKVNRPRFLANWLSRAQDKSPGRSTSGGGNGQQQIAAPVQRWMAAANRLAARKVGSVGEVPALPRKEGKSSGK